MLEIKPIATVSAWRVASQKACRAELAYMGAVLRGSNGAAAASDELRTLATELRFRADALHGPAMNAVLRLQQQACQAIDAAESRRKPWERLGRNGEFTR